MTTSRPLALCCLLGLLACSSPETTEVLSPADAYAAALEALEADDAATAEALFARMVDADPVDPVARAGLARALAHQGRFGEAIIQDKLAFALEPRLAEVAYNTACSYARLGEQEEALRWLSRAWNGGIRDLNLIEQDPDLDALRQDHRFAFFLATGALSLAEREALVEVSPALVSPDQRVRVELTVVSLNRPLMATPEQLGLRYTGDLSAGSLAPVARVERFEAGESGGREFFRRELAFTFEAREPMETMIGPFELFLDEEELPVRPAWLSVREVLPDLFARRGTTGSDAAVPDAATWFAPPSELTTAVRHPFARWEESEPEGDELDDARGGRDLVVGVELGTNGASVPADLVLELPAGCDVFSHPRTTAFLRTRAEGVSRVWFHRRLVGEAPPGEIFPGCADPLPIEVRQGDEVLFQTELPWLQAR
ncbi:MAG: tetratricopeptide repeat protein [Myxococcota bacterium]|nr:tetratricopeptide repeat protein [Myxococcota bacterium]